MVVRAKPLVPADALGAVRHVALWPQAGPRRPPTRGSSPLLAVRDRTATRAKPARALRPGGHAARTNR
jgi:hypothetical protein